MNILLPTDGSDFSLAAARACASIAAAEKDARVRVISVVEQIVPDEPIDEAGEYYAIVNEAAEAAARDRVEEARQVVLSDERNSDLVVEVKTVSGKPGKMIVKECEEWPADLVIIASHGHGFWSRTLLGSVTDSVVHHAPCSVMVIRKPQA